MSGEKKDFVSNDHDRLDKQDETKEKSKTSAQTIRFPEVSFNSFIISLSSTALFHLGEIRDPQTGLTKLDLPLAKQAIDTVSMLKEKTEGNLTEEEQKIIEGVLTDIKWRFIKAAK